jgi:fluoride ion exporter CrcB/FEX
MRSRSVTSASLISLLQKLFNLATLLSPAYKVAMPLAELFVNLVGAFSIPEKGHEEG